MVSNAFPHCKSEKIVAYQQLPHEGRSGQQRGKCSSVLRGLSWRFAVKSSIRTATCIGLVAALLATSGCGKKATGQVVAVVNGDEITLDELNHLLLKQETEIAPEHAGLAFLLNSTYKSGMSALALYEATRGVWAKVPKDENLQFAYATYGGLVESPRII